MRAEFVAVLLAALVGIAAGVSLQYTCAKDPNGGNARIMAIKLAVDAGDDVVKYFSGSTECGYDVTPGAWVSVTVVQNANGGAPDTCGVTGPDIANGKQEFTLSLQTTSTANKLVRETDRFFTFKCDFNNLPPSQTVVGGPFPINATGIPPGVATKISEDITLALVNEANTAAVVQCNVGTEVKLRVTLVTRDPGAKGLKMISCIASNGNANNPITFPLIDATGCPPGTSVIPTGGGFDPIGNQVAGQWVALTGTFKCFKFPTSDNVAFTCTAVYSNNPNVKSCVNGRKRRHVTRRSAKDQRDVMLVVKITTDNSTTSFQTAQPSRSECDNRSYVIGLAILGCVLALTFIVTVGMFVVIKRSRHDNTGGKAGCDNKYMS